MGLLGALNKILYFKHLTSCLVDRKPHARHDSSYHYYYYFVKYRTRVIYKIIIINPTIKMLYSIYELYQLYRNIYHESEIKFSSHNKGHCVLTGD